MSGNCMQDCDRIKHVLEAIQQFARSGDPVILCLCCFGNLKSRATNIPTAPAQKANKVTEPQL